MKYIYTTIYLFSLLSAKAQLHDNMWVLDSPDTMFQMDFRDNTPSIGLKPHYLDFGRAHSVFCDGNGELLYYTDCRKIYSRVDSLLENGDSLNFEFTYGVNPIQNGSFFLPAPGDSTKCYFVYLRPEKYSPLVFGYIQLKYALIDMTANNGLGKVIEKEVPILNGGVDTTNFLHPTAVRHANGRDWWILVPDRMEPKYYRILLTPQGFSQPEVQEIGFKIPNFEPYGYLGITRFSPNGSKFAELSQKQKILAFYDFDRCTGLLSNPIVYDNPVNSISTVLSSLGIAFSPFGERFYLSYGDNQANRIIQYDLEAADFLNSAQVLLDCPHPSLPFVCSLDKVVLAPDGKLYLNSAVDTVAFHVIHKPDNLGAACDFRFGELRFPANYPYAQPTDFPNFRLGPVDGSACDTLGIDNEPVAWFFWEADELSVDFSNASYHEPDTYLWDFGDGDNSTGANPLHSYPAPGTYTACLTASNAYGSHTFCRLVTVDTLPDPVLPVPAFTWDAVELEVSFTNASSNSPDNYLWDFGDPASGSGNTSTEVNPTHAYPAPGSYNTCLTASNADGSNTLCQLVTVDTLLDSVSLVLQGPARRSVSLRPNPAASWVGLSVNPPFAANATMTFFDVFGRTAGSFGVMAGQSIQEIRLEGFASGMYYWRVTVEGETAGIGKLVIEE